MPITDLKIEGRVGGGGGGGVGGWSSRLLEKRGAALRVPPLDPPLHLYYGQFVWSQKCQ